LPDFQFDNEEIPVLVESEKVEDTGVDRWLSTEIDILPRLKTRESRALGVSGLQP